MTGIRLFAGALLLFLVPGMVVAGGFQLNEHGATAMAQGGAFAARASDLSAMYFNPAGLAQLSGLHVALGGTMILPRTSFESVLTNSIDMVKQTFFIPNVYASYALENGLVFGAGFCTPFGLGTEWPENWAGRNRAVKADLKSYAVNPTVAYKINDILFAGVGFSYMWSNVKLSYFPDLGALQGFAPNGKVALDAKGNSWSINGGVIFKPLPELSIGMSYRHSTEVSFEGTATFTSMGQLAPYFPGGSGTTSIKFPNQIFAGVSYKLSQNTTLEFDYQWIGWSSYDTLVIGLPTGPVFPLAGRPLQATSKSPKDWNDASMLRLGMEYVHNEWAFRMGFIYDATPQPNRTVEPLLPDANRFEGTLGIGYKVVENWSIDVAYQLILFETRTVTGPLGGDLNTFPGKYQSTANLFGLGVSYAM
jgi:long-chain fatty acid transport protein